jgi:hypothetical protein
VVARGAEIDGHAGKEKKMQDRRGKLFWYSIPLVAALLMLLGLLWYLGLPWAANRFGFALPGAGGLPYRIHYNGHDYVNPATCAREGWCNPDGQPHALCWSLQELQQHGLWPLVQVNTLSTFLSSSYPLMIPRANLSNNSLPPVVIVPMDSDCYVFYTLLKGS